MRGPVLFTVERSACKMEPPPSLPRWHCGVMALDEASCSIAAWGRQFQHLLPIANEWACFILSFPLYLRVVPEMNACGAVGRLSGYLI